MSKQPRRKRSTICGECDWYDSGPNGPGGYVIEQKGSSMKRGKTAHGFTVEMMKLCPRCKGLGDPYQGKA